MTAAVPQYSADRSNSTDVMAPLRLAMRRGTGRNVELGLLAFVVALICVFSAAVEAGALGKLTATFWVPAAVLGVVFGLAHIAVRILAPYADPVLLPAVALINGIGVAFLRRIDFAKKSSAADRADLPITAGFGFRQLEWTAIALIFAVVLIVVVRDHRSMSRFAYTLGLSGIVLMMIPAVLPNRFSLVNGAKLWIKFGNAFSIQPGEFAKIALLVFFAYYLVKKREVLSLASRRFMGLEFPRGRDLGPVITVWLLSLMVLVFEKDLGTSLMYFGLFIATLYIATERASWLVIGLGLFAGGVFLAYQLGGIHGAIGQPFANFRLRADIWLDPFNRQYVYKNSYQLVQSLLTLGTGGLFGTGPGKGQPVSPPGVPEVQTDFIFAGLGEEIGLFGLTALLLLYLLIVQRGISTALGVRDLFGKLFTGGLSFAIGLQVFVIVGGITGLIPLTGQTTPFLSAGGSSLMANWMLIALLLRVSDAARRPADGNDPARPGTGGNGGPAKLQDAPTELMR